MQSMAQCREFRAESISAFSLMELVLVIAILGILVAIAIPRLSQGSDSGGEAALVADLRILRGAIDMYAAEHVGVYPAAKGDGTNAAKTEQAFVSQLTQYSGKPGQVVHARDAAHPFGPYLANGVPPLPVGPRAGATGVKIVEGNPILAVTAAANIGWLYNATSGEIRANDDSEAATSDKTYNEF